MKSYKKSVDQMLESGSFLEFTRKYEASIPEVQTIRLKNATVQLLDTGVLLVEPDLLTKSDKDIVISSGIHGNETAPIEIVDQLVKEIFLEKVIVKHRILFIIGNPRSMNLGQRFIDENLNRLFCGKFKDYSGTYEGQRAEKLEHIVTDFFRKTGNPRSSRLHYDLHTAIRGSRYKRFLIYPYQGEKPWDKKQLEFFRASGVTTILLSHAPSGTFSYFSSSCFAAHAFTVELGKVKPFGQNNRKDFKAITDNLRLLIMGEPIQRDNSPKNELIYFRVLRELTRFSDDFKLYLEDDVENFTELPKGFLLSEDGDKKYTTQQKGESLIFPNPKVKNGQRAGLIVVPAKI